MKKIYKKALIFSIFLSLSIVNLLFLTNSNSQAKVKVKKITVTAPSGSTKTAYVAKKKKISLKTKVTVTPNKSKNKTVTYKSKNKKIAKVSKKGLVTGVKAGTTKIVVTSKKNKKKKKTIKIVVRKNPVKSITLNSTKLNMSLGEKITLKTNINPAKNVYKKLTWKSSNTSIAKVNSNGQVSALKEGNAKITCTALDGSKKKAVCSVSVGPVISNVSLQCANILTVTLSAAKTGLTKSNFVVKQKTSPGSSYKYGTTKEVDYISSNNNGKTYTLYFDDSNRIREKTYINITIPSVNNISKEIYISNAFDYGNATNKEINYITGSTETFFNKDEKIYNSNATGTIGNLSVSGNIPKGITAYTSDNGTCITFVGKPSQKTNGSKVTITGKDELGVAFTKILYFYIGEKDTLVAGAYPITGVAYIPNIITSQVSEENGETPQSIADNITHTSYYENEDGSLDFYSFSSIINVGGGTGDYIYQLDYTSLPNYESNPDKNKEYITLDGYSFKKSTSNDKVLELESEKTYYYKNEAIEPGTYNVKVKVWDGKNKNIEPITITVPLKLVEGVTINGTIYDAANKRVRDFIDVSGYQKCDEYNNYNYFTAKVKNGTYSKRVVPGNYLICLNDYSKSPDCDNLSNYSINNNITSGKYTKNFKLTSYMVNLKPNIANSTFVTDKDAYIETINDGENNETESFNFMDLNYCLSLTKSDGKIFSILQTPNGSPSQNTLELYAYLPLGTYTLNKNNNVVKAWKNNKEKLIYTLDNINMYSYSPSGLTEVITNGSSLYTLSGTFTIKNGDDISLNANPQ